MNIQRHTSASQQWVRRSCLTRYCLRMELLTFRYPLHRSISRVMRISLLFLTMILGTGQTTVAFADGQQRTRAEAVEIAKQRSRDGRVLSVKKTVNSDGVSIFAVKIIANGRVKIYAIPEFSN